MVLDIMECEEKIESRAIQAGSVGGNPRHVHMVDGRGVPARSKVPESTRNAASRLVQHGDMETRSESYSHERYLRVLIAILCSPQAVAAAFASTAWPCSSAAPLVPPRPLPSCPSAPSRSSPSALFMPVGVQTHVCRQFRCVMLMNTHENDCIIKV